MHHSIQNFVKLRIYDWEVDEVLPKRLGRQKTTTTGWHEAYTYMKTRNDYRMPQQSASVVKTPARDMSRCLQLNVTAPNAYVITYVNIGKLYTHGNETRD